MKKAWIDLETGGLNPKVHAVLQFAMIVEDEKGKVVDKYSTLINPDLRLKIDDEALKVNGINRADLISAPTELEAIVAFTKILNKHSNKEQFEFCGYNSRFDMDFVVQMFKRTNRKYDYWTYFNFYDVDVYALVKILGLTGVRYDEVKGKDVPCKKLGCICELFGIKFKAHEAIEDIKATRKLFKKIIKKYIK